MPTIAATPTSRNWRWRRCPSCGHVAAASQFAVAQTYRAGWQTGAMRRRCPHCGREGATHEFPVVREHHAATGEVR